MFNVILISDWRWQQQCGHMDSQSVFMKSPFLSVDISTEPPKTTQTHGSELMSIAQNDCPIIAKTQVSEDEKNRSARRIIKFIKNEK